MFTPVKLGLLAATVAAAVPTSIVLYDRFAEETAISGAHAATSAGAPADRRATLAAIVPGPTGAASASLGPARSVATTPEPAPLPAAARPLADDEVVARLDAGFDAIRAAPRPGAAGPDTTRARAATPVVVDGRMVLPPAPIAVAASAVELPPGVPREPPLPEPAADPIVVAAVAPEAPSAEPAPEAAAAPRPTDLPVPKPAPREAAGKPSDELRALVRREAEAQKIPPKLAEAVVEVESGFDPDRKGADGRLGLTQINLRIAKQYGFRGSEKDLADPETNVKWGFKYLAGAYRKADGDVCRATMKFRGGHVVDKSTPEFSAYCTKVKARMASL